MVKEKNMQEGHLLHRLGGVSHKIIDNHHLENLSEFVLHDLCSDDLLSVKKAAYLVNNPDFLCMKGIVGFDRQKSFEKGFAWDNQKDFTSHMRESSFNQKVRQINDLHSLMRASSLDKAKVAQLAEQLEIEYPACHVWNMKHANQGILIFEKKNQNDEFMEYLPYFASVLSFCPIF